MLNEALFIKRLRAGDNIAFQELINAFGPRLLNTAKLLNSNNYEAEELVSDTFADAVLGINKFKQESSLISWLYRILFNRFYKQRRQRKREAVFKASFRHEIKTVDFSDPDKKTLLLFQQYLPGLLSRLSHEHKEVVLFKYFGEMKLKEIARVLRIPESTVKTRLHYAIINSRRFLKDMNLLSGAGS